QMDYVREIVSQGLKQRDQNNLPLKWPLSKVEVKSKVKISNELKEILIRELNVKEFVEKPCNDTELEVKLDFKITKELESEGYAREVSRKVQAFRKKLGFNKEEKIKLILLIDKDLKNILEGQKKLIMSR